VTAFDVPLRGQPLDLAATLANGQAFRWSAVPDQPGWWEGVAAHTLWRLAVHDGRLIGSCNPAISDPTSFLRHYFVLDVDWLDVCRTVSAAHPAAEAAVRRFPGMRILRQDPDETLLTFSIATATNVPRVTRSVAKLCATSGRVLAVRDDGPMYDFPTPPEVLAVPLDVLRTTCNLAYRAVHLRATAATLQSRGPAWLASLRSGPYIEAHRSLDALEHFGPKLADCVALMGLGYWEAVPIDTHVWALSKELFGESIKTRSLTPKTYQVVGDRWRATLGRYAGVAQQWMFHARRSDQGRLRQQVLPATIASR
jgi:N-glycosylase/DNA lyase